MIEKSDKILTYGVCLLVSIIFSLHYIVAKEILTHNVSPYSLATWRGIIGGSLILYYFRNKFSVFIFTKHRIAIFVVAFFGFFINQILFMTGLKQTTALSASLISNTIPIFSLLFATIFKIESINKQKIWGIVISFGFIAYLILNKMHNPYQILNRGNLLIVFNVLSFCFALLIGKKLLIKNIPFEILTGLMLLLGGFMMVTVSYKDAFDLIEFSLISKISFSLVIFEIIISTSVVYLLNLWTLKKLPLTQVTFFIYFQPLITSVTEVIFTHRFPSLQSLIAYLGIFVGGFLVLKNKNE